MHSSRLWMERKNVDAYLRRSLLPIVIPSLVAGTVFVLVEDGPIVAKIGAIVVVVLLMSLRDYVMRVRKGTSGSWAKKLLPRAVAELPAANQVDPSRVHFLIGRKGEEEGALFWVLLDEPSGGLALVAAEGRRWLSKPRSVIFGGWAELRAAVESGRFASVPQSKLTDRAAADLEIVL